MRTRPVPWILAGAVTLAGLVVPVVAPASAATAPNPTAADAALDRALNQFVTSPNGAPGIAVVVGRGATPQLHAAGTAVVGQARPPTLTDQMRLASVAKAFSGAVALSLVKDKVLSLTDTVSRWLPSLPRSWQQVTLAQLLNHTSGVPDFSQAKSFQQALPTALLTPPPPSALLTYVADQPLTFKPGSRYHYSNSDNIIIGLIAQAATGRSYETLLQERVSQPFGLDATSLPRDAAIPSPFIHGYQLEPGQPPEDVSEIIAAGWSWASGGVVSTPTDANRFIRAYVLRCRDHQRCPVRAVPLPRRRDVRTARTRDQRRRASDLPVHDTVRNGLRPHRQHARVHPVPRGHSRRVPVRHREREHPADPEGCRRFVRRAADDRRARGVRGSRGSALRSPCAPGGSTTSASRRRCSSARRSTSRHPRCSPGWG